MAQFLRDVHISNIKIKEDVIIQLAEVFANRANALISSAQKQGNDDNKLFLTFIIRFDGKGYRVFALADLLRYFQRAKVIERIIFSIETAVSLRSNREVGEHLSLWLDKIDPQKCYLSVTSDDSDWVDSSYSAVQEILTKCKTKNGWARSGWSTLTIQLLGVAVGFGLSIWAATLISPNLSIENAFVITFFFALLIFSNAWGYINNIVLAYVHSVFPNIQFYRPDKDRVNWVMQGIIGGLATALMLYLLNLLFSYIGKFLSEIPK
ncbi:MAG: hypothetical protein IH977_07395 [Nitrospinae bacterium]|nr:hypothetical protein [Nitrospinota bacterium]